MKPEEYWTRIRAIFRSALPSSGHYAIATVDKEGNPHVTPVGSVTLTTPGRGYYFDIFTNKTRTNLETNQRICVLAVNSGLRFWLTSLIRGAFVEVPALRLYGTVGPSRDASDEEIAKWQRKVHLARFFKGHKLLWGKLSAARVRDIHFDDVAPVKLGTMTRGLWD